MSVSIARAIGARLRKPLPIAAVAMMAVATGSCESLIRAQVRAIATELQASSKYISLQKSHLLFDSDEKPVAQFRITLPSDSAHPLYLFDSERYVFSTGAQEDRIPTAEICEAINGMYDRETAVTEALREREIGLTLTFAKWASVEINLAPILAELLIATRKLSEVHFTHTKVLVRGYADASAGDWEREIEPNQDYGRISVHPPVPGQDPSNALRFSWRQEWKDVPDHYANNDLPNLRAEFVRRNLIAPYLGECATRAESGVLDGYAFDKQDEMQRKVEVFVLLMKGKSDRDSGE